jgi:AraC-like DNA-binding protein
MLLGSHTYNPHVLSAVLAHEGIGRRRSGYRSESGLPWYTTWVLRSGVLRLHAQGHAEALLAPVALVIPPGSSAILEIPSGCDVAWMDWGVDSAERIHRAQSLAMRYRGDHRQPDPTMTWGQDPGLTIPPDLYPATEAMVLAATNRWYAGPLAQATAHADLARWIVRWLEQAQPDDTLPRWRSRIPDARARELIELAANRLELIESVAAWADIAGIGRHQLNRLMQKALGVSASAVIDRLRVDRLHDLLPAGDDMTLIADRLGFRKRDTFSRWFVRRFGMPPRDYRRSQEAGGR